MIEIFLLYFENKNVDFKITWCVAKLGSEKRIKVGHGGTLDKDAEGILVMGIGKGTQLLCNYLKCEKVILLYKELIP